MRSHAPTFDLQSHSSYSDGELTPSAVVAAAAAAGVELLALSDHDTVDGVAEAEAAAAELDIHLVPAIELSAIDARDGDLHVLGYRLDYHNPRLLGRVQEARSERGHRARATQRALIELGFELDETDLERRFADGRSIGRPHLARAVVEHPGNAARLAAEGLTDPSAFLEEYLTEGRPAFRPRAAPSVEASISLIHQAGGVAVWAHPFWNISAAQRALDSIDRFHAGGLDGVECFYPTHTHEQAELLANHCESLGLLTTGSSDFHGPGHGQFSGFRAFTTYGREPVLGPIGG